MRAILCCSLTMVALNSSLTASDKEEEKIDPTKLVGKWKRGEEKGKYPVVMEFRKDGTSIMTITAKGEDFEVSGRYRVDGNKVVIVLNDDIEHDDVYIVQKLTNTELVWNPEKPKKEPKETFTRVKPRD
ncbi:lipocalin family protein [Gemmata sp.]|uniref:lipocalin family protein n=1 Tax=Gemmata sp. TaxID=1914242 RepID=UPI003F717DC4